MKTAHIRGLRAAAAAAAAAVLLVTAATGAAMAEPEAPEAPGSSQSSSAQDFPYLLGARAAWVTEVNKLIDADPANAAAYKDVLARPVGEWVGGGEIAKAQAVMEAAKKTESVPVLIFYNIPDRDLGSHSGGGAAAAQDYQEWIGEMAGVIGEDNAVVVLEPDALPHMPEVADPGARAKMLGGAITELGKLPNTRVYLDAGHPDWHDAETTAKLIGQVQDAAGVPVPGIALNVSNFKSEVKNTAYAEKVALALDRKDLPVLIDNSRNGDRRNDDSSQWCNPEIQRLGELPDVYFDPDSLVEHVYVKTPGESDGVCGVSRAGAGQFDPALLQRQLGIG